MAIDKVDIIKNINAKINKQIDKIKDIDDKKQEEIKYIFKKTHIEYLNKLISQKQKEINDDDNIKKHKTILKMNTYLFNNISISDDYLKEINKEVEKFNLKEKDLEELNEFKDEIEKIMSQDGFIKLDLIDN